MIAEAEDRAEVPATQWSGIEFPVGWNLQAATFSWLEEAARQRSAEDIFAGLTERRPDVLLKSRVPTYTLPCREYAAGDWLGHGLEVAVTGEDFSVRITLVEKSGASRPFVVATRGAIAAIRALTEHRTSMKELSLSLAMTGLRSEMAHATFASALGLAAPELGIANQRYLRRKRHRIGAERDGFLDVLFELATSGEHEDAHSLELRSQARAHSRSNSSDQEDWSILLGASLATVSSIIV